MKSLLFISLLFLYSNIFSQGNPFYGYWEQVETGYSNAYMKFQKYGFPLNDAFIIDEYTIEAAGNLFDNMLFITPEEMKLIDDSLKDISENNVVYYNLSEDGYLSVKLPVLGYERNLKIITLTSDTLILERDGWYYEKFAKRTFTDITNKEPLNIKYYRSGKNPLKYRKKPAPSQFTLEITYDRKLNVTEENNCFTTEMDYVSYNMVMKLLSYINWANISAAYTWGEEKGQYTLSVYNNDSTVNTVKADEFTYLAPIQLKTLSRRLVMIYNTLSNKSIPCK